MTASNHLTLGLVTKTPSHYHLNS